MCLTKEYLKEMEGRIQTYVQDEDAKLYNKMASLMHTPSPETRDMLVEWKRIKWAAFGILFAIGSWVATMQLTMNEHTNNIADLESRMREQSIENKQTAVSIAEVKARLVGIETLLVDIKSGLNSHLNK